MSVRLTADTAPARSVLGEAFRALVLFSSGTAAGLLTVVVLRVVL